MVCCRTISLQRQKCIAMCQSPLDNLFNTIDAESFDIVLKNDGNVVLLNAGDDILNDNRGIGCLTGVSAGNIPVKILEAHICKILSQFGHDTGAIVLADCVGASARKTNKGRMNASSVFNGFLLFAKISKVGIFAGINRGVIMGCTVNTDGMTGISFGFQ
mgnify:CR=1 FL=1